jgi:hypothetical protein
MSVPVVVLLISFGFVTFLLRFLFALSRERRVRPIYRAMIFTSIVEHPEPIRKRSSNRALVSKRQLQGRPVSESPLRQNPLYRLRLHL